MNNNNTMSSRNCLLSRWVLTVMLSPLCVVLPTTSTVPDAAEPSCSRNCRVENGLYTVGNDGTKGAPTIKHSFGHKDITLKQYVTISCVICHSHPPSSLTWYHNGKTLSFMKSQITRIKGFCGQRLSVHVLSQNDVGVYTCVVKNTLGQANSTTELRQYVAEKSISLKKRDITLHGDVMGNDVQLGSTINITCWFWWQTEIRWLWTKGSSEAYSYTNNSGYYHEGRIQTTQYSWNDGNNSTKRVTILKITDAKYGDTGKYKCVGEDKLVPGRVLVNMSVTINVVRCFQGYYCPRDGTKKRCPKGTFSWSTNATSVHECQQCPTNSRNETLISLTKKNSKLATTFRTNCPDFLTSGLLVATRFSTGVIAGIVLAIVMIIIAVSLITLCFVRNWRREKEDKLFEPSKFIDLEIPQVPLTNDVYVCYSGKNRRWVHDTLLAKLKAQNFRTVIDFIDFEIGVAVQENINRAIYGSRKTVFVLSKDAIRNFYARTELRQALVARKKGRHVIIVLYEKVKLPVEITKRVYLDWTDERNREMFWEKLYGEIRKPLEVEMV